MLCASCGKTTHTTDFCENCGAALPSREAPPYQNAPYEDLNCWCQLYEEGHMEAEEFSQRLQARRQLYENTLAEIGSMDIPEDTRADVAEELKVGRLGVEGLLRAVTLLQQWQNSQDDNLKVQALSTANHSNQMVNKAMSLNCRSFRTIQETAEEMIEQMANMV